MRVQFGYRMGTLRWIQSLTRQIKFWTKCWINGLASRSAKPALVDYNHSLSEVEIFQLTKQSLDY